MTSVAEIFETMAYGPVILAWDQKLYFIFLVIAVVVVARTPSSIGWR